MKKHFIILLVMAVCSDSISAATFDTPLLERMAGYLSLQRLDTLHEGVTNTYAYRNHPLTIRKNKWGEIEHIGLLLLPQTYREINPSPIYDFIERDLLARMITPDDTEDAFRQKWTKVYFSAGNAETSLRIDTTAQFSYEYVDLRAYKAAWEVGGKKILEMSFPMNYQMLIGGNALEIEDRFIRRLRRYQAHDVIQDITKELPNDGLEFTYTNSYYMSTMVRNDVYYTRDMEEEPWRLVNDTARATRTINNWMIASDSENEIPLEITFDKYGYEVDSLFTNYRTWQQFCMEEGCTPYFGIKNKYNGIYECSVFMVNKTGGYVHLLSINIPEETLKDPGNITATARMYAYIPLYNVRAKLLHNVEYEPIN